MPLAFAHHTGPRYQEFSFAAVRYYPELIAKLAAAGEPGVDFDVVGGLVVGNANDQLEAVVRRLRRHLDSGVKEIGQVRFLETGAPRELFPYLDSALAGVYLSGAARVSGETIRIALLNAALKVCARAIVRSGPVPNSAPDVRVVGIRVNQEMISADAVVVAAGAWSADLCRPLDLQLRVEPQRGQILHLNVQETNTEALPSILPVLSDYYLLAFRDSRVIIGATRETNSGFDFRITAGGVAEVLREGLRIAPGLTTATLAEIRVGFLPDDRDGLPLLGGPEATPGLVIATGFGRYGLTVGPYAGRYVAQLALGKTLETDLACFEPDRLN